MNAILATAAAATTGVAWCCTKAQRLAKSSSQELSRREHDPFGLMATMHNDCSKKAVPSPHVNQLAIDDGPVRVALQISRQLRDDATTDVHTSESRKSCVPFLTVV